MNKRQISSSGPLRWGALRIAGVYLILGSMWILFSDQIAARAASSQAMLATISLYKGWGYVLVTALLLYWLIQRHTARLHAGELQLQQVLDAMPALISYVDKDRQYRFTNEAYIEWFGENPEGKHIGEVLGKTTYQKVSQYVDRVLNGETIYFESEVPYRDGEERYLSTTYIPETESGGQVRGFFVLAQDMTERRQAQEELRQWADAFEGCAHGIAIGDPNTNRIVVCNPAFARMHWSSVEDIAGSAILSLYASSDHEHVRRNVQKADQIGHARFEARMIRRDRSTFPVQMDVVSVLGEDGEVLHRVTTAQDISERRQAEEELRKSEEKYRYLFENNPHPMWVYDRKTLAFLEVNEAAIIKYGYSREEFLNMTIADIRPPEDLERLMNNLAQPRQPLERSAGWKHRLKDGTIIDVEITSHTVELDGHESALVIAEDVTERVQAQNIIQHKDALLRLTSEMAKVGGWEFDPETGTGTWTDEVARIHDLDPSQATDVAIGLSFYADESRAKIEQAVKEAIELAKPYDLELEMTSAKGNRKWVRTMALPLVNNGKVIKVQGIYQDITERKRAEDYLRRFELLSEHSRDIILFMGHKDGRILEANAAALQSYGYSRDELLTLTIRDLRAHNTSGLTAEQMAQADAGGILFETIHQRKDGTTFPVEVSSQGATISGVRTLISIVRDISERRKAEEALRQSEQRLKRAQEIAHLGSWELDLANNRLIWSDEVYRIFGLQPQEFDASYETFLEAVHPEDRAAVDAAYSDSIQAGRDSYEIEHRVVKRSSREVRIVHEKCEHFRNADGQIIRSVGMVHDITERKNAEKALTESESRFRSLFEQSTDAHLLLENGIFTDCNPATVQMMRARSKEEILSSRPSDLSSEYQPDGRPSSEKADEMIRIALEQGSNRFEWIHRRMDGTDVPVEVLLTSISTRDRQVIHAVWRDITERKQIEQALQAAHDELEIKVQERTAALSEANALLQALMDNLPDHIYFKDTQSRFIRNSRSQASLLGLNDPSEATGKTDFDFFPHAARSYAEEQEIMRSGKPLVDFEEWVVWPDGRETWVLTTKLPLRNSEGQTIGIFGISHDITERKRAEQAIRQLNADLEKQAEQLQAANKELEAFSYSVSHDLRAPLRAIDGYTRILVEDYEAILDDEGKRVCSVISREARRMGQLIDDLLSFSRLGRKEMYSSKIDMRGLAVSVLNELLKEENRERMDFHIGKLPEVKGDSSLIRQVWVNLLANAIKFTSKKERAVIEVGGKTTKDEIIYSVRDNGAGFDMEYGNKLFGVFQRLHSESEFSGTGVGLAIVQRIIRRHGGHVWAEGEVEKGATFYFALPRKENLS